MTTRSLPNRFLVVLIALACGTCWTGCGNTSKSSTSTSKSSTASHHLAKENSGPPKIPGELYEQGRGVWIKNCKLCHEDGGEDDAPILGDTTEWAKRLQKGKPTLIKNAFEGIGMMPARGGRKGTTDEDLKAAIEYMVKASQ